MCAVNLMANTSGTVSCHLHHLAHAFLQFVPLTFIKDNIAAKKGALWISDYPLLTTREMVTTTQL